MANLDSRLTVADLRLTLQKWTDPASITYPPQTLTPANGPNFIPRLNEVAVRLDQEGLWKDATQSVWYSSAPLGYITLPRRCLTVQGADIGGNGQIIFTGYNEYKLGSLGWKKADEYTSPGWTDLGDNYCTTQDIDPSAPATLRIKITNVADAGKVIRLIGLDADGAEIMTAGVRGISVTTANPSVTTSQVFASLDAIDAAVMTYPWSIWMVISGVETKIGSYEPGETRPCYHRYKTGIITQPIRVYARRRIIDLVDETDFVNPGNRAAFEFGLRARALEDTEHQDDADKLWSRGIRELDNQVRASRGRVKLTLPFQPALPRSLPECVR